jgi:hypothetical protein
MSSHLGGLVVLVMCWLHKSWWFWLVPHQVSTSQLAKSTVRNTHKNTTNTHINKMSRRCPTLQRLCPLPPWVGQRPLQNMAPWPPMVPCGASGRGLRRGSRFPCLGYQTTKQKKGDMGGAVAFGVCRLIEWRNNQLSAPCSTWAYGRSLTNAYLHFARGRFLGRSM